jgi:hypothetical protein
MVAVSHEASPSSRKEFIREAVTMALYLSLSLLAVLLAIPTSSNGSVQDPVGLIFLTAVGLLVAHLLAFAISSRLVTRGMLDAQARLIALAQIVGGAVVVVLVMLPMLFFDAPTSVQIGQALLLTFVAAVGYLAARQSQVSRFRSLVYVGVVVVSVLVVLGLKAAVGH